MNPAISDNTAAVSPKEWIFISKKYPNGKDTYVGRTMEKVIIRNLVDVINVVQGNSKENDVRTEEIVALVDTGAAFLCLPPSVIDRLGLTYSRSREVMTANGLVKRRIFKGAEVTIRERNEEMPVMENDATTPPLIGYLVLEMLDFVVDLKSETLIPNPEHDGKWIMDAF